MCRAGIFFASWSSRLGSRPRFFSQACSSVVQRLREALVPSPSLPQTTATGEGSFSSHGHPDDLNLVTIASNVTEHQWSCSCAARTNQLSPGTRYTSQANVLLGLMTCSALRRARVWSGALRMLLSVQSGRWRTRAALSIMCIQPWHRG